MSSSILIAVREELLQNADAATRASAQRFFKESVKFHGVKSDVVKKIAKKYYLNIKGSGKGEILSLCEDLLKSEYGEEAFIAFEWSYAIRKNYEPGDFQVFEKWVLNYVDNWAKCDTLCNHTLGSFVDQYPKRVNDLKN